ncbi:MAG: hypothetical protein AAF417_13005 [Pseudomonadota bacterium]
MVRSAYAIVLSIALMATASVANAQEIVELPLHAQPGDQLLVDYTIERTQNDEQDTGRVSASVVVADVYDDSFVATWTTTSVSVDGFQIDATSPEAADYFLGVPIRYLAGVDGAPLRIVDKDAFIETLFASSVWAAKSQASVASAAEFFNSLSEEALAKVFLKVPTYMSLCQGTTLPLGERSEFSVDVPSPLGGKPAAAVVSYQLRAVDDRVGSAQVAYEMKLDPDAAKRLTIAMLKQLGVDDVPADDRLDELLIQRNDAADCSVDTGSGWVTAMTYQNEISVADQYRAETYSATVDYRRAGERN